MRFLPSRLVQLRPRYRLLILASLAFIGTAGADVIYSGLQNIAIALGFDGTTVNIDTGTQVPAESTGWDINAFFGGAGVANSPSFQPVRIGTGNQDQILRLNTGDVIDASRLYSTGYGGSDSHLGTGATQFQPGQEAYLGFKFFTDGNAGPYYGWARVIFTANQPGGVIEDFAYDTTASSITAGRVLQGLVGGQQTLTLSGAAGETYTLGTAITDVGGNANNLLKTGAGAWKLTGDNTYTGSTTIAGGILELGTGTKLSQTASVAVQTTGTLLLSGTGGLNSKLNPLANVTLAGGTIQLATTTHLDQQVGALTLSANSTLDFGTLAGGNTFRFGDSAGSLWATAMTLNILNFTLGEDHLYFGTTGSSLTSTQLAQVRFFGDNGSYSLGTGLLGADGELAPIPEPATWLAGALLLGVATWRERKRFARLRPAQR